VAERLYGVRVVPWPDAPSWDPTVRTFVLLEPDGTPSARFYVDVFPRETKRDGAWMHGIHLAPLGKGEHVEMLVANFSPPIGDRPALLRHRELETLFHEFGHLLHHASSRVPVRTLGGTNVARDFVELPSQIMENWCWERDVLDLFARHHETAAPLPEPIFSRMRAARSFRAANVMMRQLGFAELDLALHRGPLAPGADIVATAREILGRYAPARLPDDYAMVCSFAHLFASSFGYAAGYYSYKWAEVLEADAFSRFKTAGIFSRDVGAAFRDHILSRGDAEDPAELFRQFMGRDPRLEALLERDGLMSPG
jgi:oligopeptidase A